MNTRRVKLTLVQPSDVIDAAQSRPLQLLARRCQAGDLLHRGLLHTMATLAQNALEGCLPPGARTGHLECLAQIRRWSVNPFPLKAKALRSELLEAAIASEALTVAAVTQMLTLSPQLDDPLQPQLGHAFIRHARQASYYACSSVVLTLDALDDPRRAIDVPGQVAGAFAHKAIWSMGGATLLEHVHDHAAFWHEHEHSARDPHRSHTLEELQLQLLYEFIGVTWKAQRDAQFSRLCSFLDWALMLASSQ